MSISPEITPIVEQLFVELNQTEEEVTKGVNLAQQLLSNFSDNAILAQCFAYFNTILFFLKISRIHIEATVKAFSVSEVSLESIEQLQGELQNLLKQVLEVKTNVNNTTTRLGNWS
ncbi:MAG: hypothetical protein QNJ54_00320 [Prochloraceae cyanobacterium]|nr:hypothetical protein [Prochloraceae cyanobacterium]